MESTFFPRSMLRREITEFSADKIHIAQLVLRSFRAGMDLPGLGYLRAIADALKDRKVNAVTNSILAAAILTQNHNADVLTGHLSGYDHFLRGRVCSPCGTCGKAGLALPARSTRPGFPASTYERGVRGGAQGGGHRGVCAGSEKFGVTSFTSIAPLGSADLVLSDEGMPLKYQRHFAGLGVPIAISAKGPPPAYLPKEGPG